MAKEPKLTQKKVVDFILKRDSSLKAELLILLGLGCLVAVFRWRVFGSFDYDLLGGTARDAGLYSWLIKSNLSDLLKTDWFSTKAFYPYTKTLAWSDNFILPAILVSPLIQIGFSIAAAWNVLLITVTLLNGYCTYRLSYLLSGELLFSFVAGAGFMLCSYLTGSLGHPQLQFAFFIPLALIPLVTFLRTRQFRYAFACGLINFFAFLTCAYYAIFIPVCIGSFIFCVMLVRPKYLIPRRSTRFVLGYLVGLSPIVPFLLPYLEVKDTFGPRFLYEPFYFSANAFSYLSSFPDRILYGVTSIMSHAEAYLFPGVVLLVSLVIVFTRLIPTKKLRVYWFIFLLLFTATCVSSIWVIDDPKAGIFCALSSWGSLLCFILFIRKLGYLERQLKYLILTNRDIIATLLFTALLCFLISLGPLGNSSEGKLAIGVQRVFFEFVPGFDSLRAISRVGLVVILYLFLCLPFALRRINKYVDHSVIIAGVALVLVLTENNHETYPLDPIKPRSSVFSYLESTAQENRALMVLPWTASIKPNGQVDSWGDFAEKNVTYMHWAAGLPTALVNGYSGQRSYIMKEFPRKMSGFPDERSLNALSSIPGLRYIIYATELAPPGFSLEAMLERAGDYQGQLTFINADESGNYLFEFHPRLKHSDTFFLRVPSSPQGTLHIDFLAIPSAGETHADIKFVLRDHFPEAPIAEAKFPTDGEWHTFSVPIPETSDSVRPLRLYFPTEQGTSFFIGDSVFVPNIK